MEAIKLNDICKVFDQKQVLNKVNLKIENREIFGLLGPSGAGKTTLIKILTGQLGVSGGEALIFGENSKKLKENNYKQIGMVMDNSGLYNRLSCFDNLKLFIDIYKLDKSRIKEVLDQVGLKSAVKTPVEKLSKGMKQRLILARSILHNPKLLFLDEPTSGLDPTTTKSIHELLLQLRDNGMTIFLTTHNMEEAAKICDNIALLHEGNIIEYGKPEDLCRKYDEQNQIKIYMKNNKILNMENKPENAMEIGNLFMQGRVLTIHSCEPNLEQVFLTLTGRGLES